MTSSRRLAMPAAVVAALVLGTAPGWAGSGGSGGTGDAYTTNCPAPESLVTGTTWDTHKLAPGVVLKEGQHSDSRGKVRMHVLRVDMTNAHVGTVPVMRQVAMRAPLSALAKTQKHLVAVTNGGYFDFGTGAPIGTVIAQRHPLVASPTTTWAVGQGANGLIQAGHVTSSGWVKTVTDARPLDGLNLPSPAIGLTAYTPKWGLHSVPSPKGTIARYIRKGKVDSGAKRFTKPPTSGSLLVARGSVAVQWLKAQGRGTSVAVRPAVSTDAPSPFVSAYAVGTQIVAPGGQAKLGLSCRKSYKQPARTAVGFTDGGRTMLLVSIDDKKGTALHGLASIQVARVMADLGADQAYLLDGGGSTEMLARMPATKKLGLRTTLSDGVERPVPVGVGIVRR